MAHNMVSLDQLARGIGLGVYDAIDSSRNWLPHARVAVSSQLNVMDTAELRRQIRQLMSFGESKGDRVARAQQAIDLIRPLGPYRWAGLYDVLATEIAVIAWSGPEAPTHPRFSIAKGLNGACVSSREPVIRTSPATRVTSRPSVELVAK